MKTLYLDGYADESIPGALRDSGFSLFDGRTLTACMSEHRLLAISRSGPARCAKTANVLSSVSWTA